MAVIQLEGPVWWYGAETRVWSDSGPTREDWAPVNAGQLKHVAAQAKRYLDLRLAPAGGAGSEIDALVESFENVDNFAPINVGQLKHVAASYYRRLAAVGFSPRSELLAVGVPAAALDAQDGADVLVPWDTQAPPAENAAPVNIGQLKVVFSFDVDAWVEIDADGNGNPDWLDALGIGNPIPPGQDTDGDGMTDLAEIALGRDPNTDEFAAEQIGAETFTTGLRVFAPAGSRLP